MKNDKEKIENQISKIKKIEDLIIYIMIIIHLIIIE